MRSPFVSPYGDQVDELFWFDKQQYKKSPFFQLKSKMLPIEAKLRGRSSSGATSVVELEGSCSSCRSILVKIQNDARSLFV